MSWALGTVVWASVEPFYTFMANHFSPPGPKNLVCLKFKKNGRISGQTILPCPDQMSGGCICKPKVVEETTDTTRYCTQHFVIFTRAANFCLSQVTYFNTSESSHLFPPPSAKQSCKQCLMVGRHFNIPVTY